MSTSPVMSITDDQVAEIEYLASNATRGDWEFHICEIRANYDSDGYTVIAESPSVPKNWRDQRDTNMRYMATVCPAVAQALIARLREAERDAARYQFLRDSGKFSPSAFGDGWALNCGYTRAQPSLLDAAIDAAMQEPQQ